MLEVEKLSAHYGNLEVLKEITFSLKQGEKVGILGVNGAGKTTMFNTLFYQNHSKHFFKNNGIVVKQDDIAYIESENEFYPFLTVKEFLQLVSDKYMDLSITWCDAFSLSMDNLTNTLSTGQKKKLAIIANLIVDKNIYFFDEPFNGLDFESYEMLQKLLKSSFFSTKYVIISSHILDSLSSICDEILFIKDGEIAKIFNQEHFADIKVFYSDSINLGVQSIMNAIEEWKIDHSKE